MYGGGCGQKMCKLRNTGASEKLQGRCVVLDSLWSTYIGAVNISGVQRDVQKVSGASTPTGMY